MYMPKDLDQFRRPAGEEGRLLLNEMNEHHRGLSEWALSKVPRTGCRKILDIGCGGGMFISLLAHRYPDAHIEGIDISETSVAAAAEYNREIVNKGRCHISLGSVSELPFDAGTFDLVTAVETYFFWPDISNDIRKAASTVRNDGILLIVSETYPHPDFKERNEEFVRSFGLKLLENKDMAEIIEKCSMDVTVSTDEKKNWVTFVGRKRSDPAEPDRHI
ncbi:MAG: methyltransferase domain-containing protein [Methanomassiliicoccaceae archaeon]|nr:methyltransferase domain-containing protein [Methanomassiliicoccaceae archaeon]